MKNTEEILSIIETAFLQVKIETHAEMTLSTGEGVNTFRIRVADDLLARARPLIQAYLEERMMFVSDAARASAATENSTKEI